MAIEDLRVRLPRALLLASFAVATSCCDASTPAAAADKALRGDTTTPASAEKTSADAADALRFVGREACGECHAEQVAAYAHSPHDMAMQSSERSAVVAPFDGEDVRATHTRAAFVQESGRFFVSAQGRDWPVRWTLGFEPLQQVLVESDRGRVQAYPVAFDTRTAQAGGQGWYVLPDLDQPPGDPLHWQGVALNWNRSCADCHSTNVRKCFSLDRDSYETSFSEPDVSCEACHGPASRHVRLARAAQLDGQSHAGFERDLRKHPGRHWARAADEPIAHLIVEPGASTSARLDDTELGVCARCHSRRNDLGGEGLRYDDRYTLQWIDVPHYFADGQIREEVYVLGSFLQSAMHLAGVTCSDCHDPHTSDLRAPPQQLCAKCHDPEHFDVPAHHMHGASGSAPECVDCHMPERTYMGIDARRDHRLGVPRPDLSASLGVPNPCASCHEGREDAWFVRAIARVHGPERKASPWPAIHGADGAMGQAGQEAIASVVADVAQPALVRSSALVRWARSATGPALAKAIEEAARAADPLLRRAAAQAGRALPGTQRVARIGRLLKDPRRTVRIEAASALLHARDARRALVQPPGLHEALIEAREARAFQADTVDGLLALAAIDSRLGDPELGLSRLALAVERFPESPQTFANWADALRAADNESEAGVALRRGLALHPHSGALHHAQGLWFVRHGERDRALASLQRAVELARDAERARFEAVYAVAKRDLVKSAVRGQRASHAEQGSTASTASNTQSQPSRPKYKPSGGSVW